MTAESVSPNDRLYVEPSEELIGALTEAIEHLAFELARDLAVPIEGLPAGGEGVRTADQAVLLGRQTALANMRVLREVGPAAKRLAAVWAERSGHRGTTYRQLGEAWGVTRQAARNRWPGVVVVRDQRPPVSVKMAGGTADIRWEPEDGDWCWSATGANGEDQSGLGCASSQEAAAHAGAFLVANSL